MVGRVGLEPTANGLKGRCSTIELPTRVDARDGIEPSITLLQRVVLPFDHPAIIRTFALLGLMNALTGIPVNHRSRLFKFLTHNGIIISYFYTRVKRKIKKQNKKKEMGNA